MQLNATVRQLLRNPADTDALRSFREATGLCAEESAYVLGRLRAACYPDGSAGAVASALTAVYADTGSLLHRTAALAAWAELGMSMLDAGMRLDKARGLPCPSHLTLARAPRPGLMERGRRFVGAALDMADLNGVAAWVILVIVVGGFWVWAWAIGLRALAGLIGGE